MIAPLEYHPYANLFPLIEGPDFDALVEDIRQHGLREKIVLLNDQILDGRNRYRALQQLAADKAVKGKGWRVPPMQFDDALLDPYDNNFDIFTDIGWGFAKNPLEWVVSKNLHRRHLDESQRAMVGAKLRTLKLGRPVQNKPANLPVYAEDETPPAPAVEAPAISQAQAAEQLNVSERLVRAAKVVIEKGIPELRHAVEQGRLPVSAAEQAARLDADTQQRIVQEADAGRTNAVRTTLKKAKREKREADLGAKQRALPEKKYGVIYADPEWRMEPYSRETGLDRAPDNHYPTTDTLDIITRPVGAIAAADCVLFLWATAPMLTQALNVMSAWGFEYKTHRIWHKTRSGSGRGTGYWFTGEHELLLVGTRGKVVAPATAFGPSLVPAPVGRHSEKPAVFAEMIEALFPNVPKIELNARVARPGWDVWGNEAPEGDPCAMPATTSVADATCSNAADATDAKSQNAGPTISTRSTPNSISTSADAQTECQSSAANPAEFPDIPEFLRRKPPEALA